MLEKFPYCVSSKEEILDFNGQQNPRNNFLDKTAGQVKFYSFTYASEFAPAVCYIRIGYSDQSFVIRVFIGQARAAPPKI